MRTFALDAPPDPTHSHDYVSENVNIFSHNFSPTYTHCCCVVAVHTLNHKSAALNERSSAAGAAAVPNYSKWLLPQSRTAEPGVMLVTNHRMLLPELSQLVGALGIIVLAAAVGTVLVCLLAAAGVVFRAVLLPLLVAIGP